MPNRCPANHMLISKKNICSLHQLFCPRFAVTTTPKLTAIHLAYIHPYIMPTELEEVSLSPNS